MADFSGLLQGVRMLLGHPAQDNPTQTLVIEALDNALQHQHTQLMSSRESWDVDYYTLSASSGTEDYLVTAANFSRPFWIHTVDSSSTYHTRREIPFTLLADADQRYQGPQQAAGAYQWSASEIAFYRRAGSWYARLIPIPGGTGDYRVWYSVDKQNVNGLTETPGLNVFHHLVKTQAALSLIPHCVWHGLTERQLMAKMEMLERTLLRNQAEYQKQFSSYLANISRESVHMRQGFADDYELDNAVSVGVLTGGWGW